MDTTKLTVRLPRKDIEFAKKYAKDHGLTLTELIDRYFRSLQSYEIRAIHAEVESISGILPQTVDVEQEYREYLVRKHR